ncbi:hypothetical protein ACFL3V_06770 [Nanoarchaeota archaeon]
MLGNITLVQPLERLYNKTFQKQWDKAIDRIRLTSPGDLEEMDVLIKKLDMYYEISGIKKLSMSLGTYPDEYANKIRNLKSDLCETISRKFRHVSRQVTDLIGDPDSLSDYDKERKQFDEAISQFRMLRAFYRRWRLDVDKYRYAGERFDFSYALKELAFRLAKKRMQLMNEYGSMKKIVDYKQKIQVLDEISDEVAKLFDWYKGNYLNLGSDSSWIGTDQLEDDAPWMPVDFLDNDPSIAPLERFRNIPSHEELHDVQKLFDRFVEFYRNHELIELNELGTLSDFAKFRDYAANFSLYSDDADERLKAGLMEQMLMLHQVLRDARERVNLKHHTEMLLQNSFAMYFAPIDEVYEILQRGYISSEHSIHHKVSNNNYDNLVFHLDADIKDGDIGFIFPVTKLLDGHRFYQVAYDPKVKEGLTESNSDLHVFSHRHGKPLKIDIRNGIFIAPKHQVVSYCQGNQPVKETCEQYFKRFFAALGNCDTEWFECSRLQNWLSRHCIFYDDPTRVELLNMFRDKRFVSIINHFTNRKYDNLALSQVPGKIAPSDYYVTHKFERMPEDRKEVLGYDTFNLTLFEWERTEHK